MDYKAVSKSISTRLLQIDRDQFTLATESPWYHKALSRITLLAAGDEIVYVSGAIGSVPLTGEPSARIVVITTGLVIESVVLLHGGSPDEFEPTVTAISRRSIFEVEALGVLDVFDGSASLSDWPGSFQVILRYPNDRQIVLPCGAAGTAEGALLYEVLPELVSDLSK